MEKEAIKTTITGLAEKELAQRPDYFLVQVKITPSAQVKVFVDADGGAAIDQLAAINRALYRKIDEAALFGTEGNFSLEVSSPGLDEPLHSYRQYRKNIGRRVAVGLLDETSQEGTLLEVTEEGIVLEQVSGSKKVREIKQTRILFNQIKYTKVCVVF
jgi:ribosome maturation factor RimP